MKPVMKLLPKKKGGKNSWVNAVLAFHVKEQNVKCELLCRPDKAKGNT